MCVDPGELVFTLAQSVFLFSKEDFLNSPTTLYTIGSIQILTYLNWGMLGAAIFDCVIRSCDLFDWFIRRWFGPTVIPGRCVVSLSKRLYSPKVLVIPRNRWLRLNMTEKLFTGTLNHNKNKKTKKPTVIPAVITSLGLFCVLTMCYFFDNVTGKVHIKISWLIFMLLL